MVETAKKNASDSTFNLLIFTIVSSLWATIYGLIGPFYVVHIGKISGGIEKLGIAFFILAFSQSATSYFAGRFSDKIGRKPFLFITAYINAIILVLYTIVDQAYQVYILQGILGVTNGILGTIEISILGDLTIDEKRGRIVGAFKGIVSLASSTGLLLGGFVAKIYGIDFLFYSAAAVVACSTILLIKFKSLPHRVAANM